MFMCRHRQNIINSLQDTDISIRRRSLDLLFAMCSKGNVREIVSELLSYLQASQLLQRLRVLRIRESDALPFSLPPVTCGVLFLKPSFSFRY